MVWLRWPEEIEASLFAQYGLDIGHWNRLTVDPDTRAPRLSSRRLLALLEKMPDTSEFKKASERGGRQARSERVAEETYNEIARLRASFHVAHGGKEAAYEPHRYLDPIDERLVAERESEEAEQAQRAVAEFEMATGYS